jgi:hypothetical protein
MRNRIIVEQELDKIKKDTLEGIDIFVTGETDEYSPDIIIKYYDKESVFYKNNLQKFPFKKKFFCDYGYEMWITDYIGDKDVINLTIPGNFSNKVISEISTGFNNLEKLESVVIGEGVEEIGVESFSNCISLKEITIPKTCKTLRPECFKFCSSLISIDLSSVTLISFEVFLGCKGLENVLLSNDITHIGISAFGGCANLKNIKLSDKLLTIGNYAFAGCESIETITLPPSIKELGNYVFYGWKPWQTIFVHADPKNSVFKGKWLDGCQAKVVFSNSI